MTNILFIMPDDQAAHDCYHDRDGDLRVTLRDGVFGGYRHHDRNGVAPRYPFGFGLGYTRFAFRDLELRSADGGFPVEVSFTVENTGRRRGSTVAQVYVGEQRPCLPRPVKELKATMTGMVSGLTSAFAAVLVLPGWRVPCNGPRIGRAGRLQRNSMFRVCALLLAGRVGAGSAAVDDRNWEGLVAVEQGLWEAGRQTIRFDGETIVLGRFAGDAPTPNSRATSWAPAGAAGSP